ncbi:glycosyltransferase [Shewanella halifaxensis]|uniref:glycosyltransferase n=1 Tax=Shewanella halifaxensis TaxID=271098 RepID=UPI000D58CB91|nr:glycosyltransferase [Shewanella halifaxensis]
MKSILHIGKFYPPFNGGIENFMAELLANCQNDKYRASALVHQHQFSLFSSNEVIQGVQVYRAACFGRFMFAPVSPWFLVDLSKCINAHKPDVLHLHMPNTSVFWALLFPKARRIPWVVHWHADVLGSMPKWYIKLLYPAYRIFERMVLSRATSIICTSPAYRDSSKAIVANLPKVKVIPLGLQNNDTYVESNNETLTRKLKILVVGRLSYYKGHRVLLQAMDGMNQSEIDLMEVVIVGHGEESRDLICLFKSRGLTNVTFTGSVSNSVLDNWYAWCDLICLPSIERTEAFGLVILEAAKRKKPALVTDVKGSGMSWVVDDAITGWVVRAGDADSLRSKIVSIIKNKESCTELGSAAYQKFLSSFLISKVASDTLELYNEV